MTYIGGLAMTDFPCSTANLADACDRLSIARRYAPLAPISPGMRIAGPARPVIHRGSVDVFFAAMEDAQPGDVLVIDNEGRLDEACIGDLTVLEAQVYRMAGVVLFGAHRDTAELRDIGLPLFSLGVCALGPRGLRPVQDRACTIHDVSVMTGDMVFADDDGVLFVEAAHAQRVIEVARDIRERERRQADLAREGTSLHHQFQWQAYVERSRERADYTFREHVQSLGRAIEI